MQNATGLPNDGPLNLWGFIGRMNWSCRVWETASEGQSDLDDSHYAQFRVMMPPPRLSFSMAA
jgi:hypothetical protein